MLKKIRLLNYKGFLDTDDIEIRPVTIILGKNSSGKSSLCKLFPILRDALDRPDDPFPLVSEEGVMLAQRYETLFHNLDFTNLELGLTFDDGRYMESHYMMTNGEFFNYHDAVGHEVPGSGGDEVAVTDIGRPRRPGSFFSSALLNAVGLSAEQRHIDVNFIGPIRCAAPESLKKTDAFRRIPRDDKGEYTYLKLLDPRVLGAVSAWMEQHLEGQRLEMQVTDSLMTRLSPYVTRGKVSLPLSEVGEGVTQVLPIIIQSYAGTPGSLTVLEQPALHLHPAAHAGVAERLAESAKSTGQRYVIETHSYNLMLGFIRMVANPDIDFHPEDIVIYFIDSDSSPFKVEKIEVLEDGTLTTWPHGVFEESLALQEQILDRR